MSVVTLSLFRFDSASGKCWALWQMLESRWAFGAIPDIGFHKMFGTGTREGFHPYPNFGVYGLFAVWPTLTIARQRIAEERIFNRYRNHSQETWTVYMKTSRCRGKWDGDVPFTDVSQDCESENAFVAVLTRATVKLRHVPAFWKQVPGITGEIRNQDKLLVKVGLGEIPWIHQVTFTIWNDLAALREFAFEGYHGNAINRVREGGWFKEELFARFHVLEAHGTWEGTNPLQINHHELHR